MSKKILIADDSMLIRRQVTAALTAAGYVVVEAVDGEDARQKLTPDLTLIVCDLNMPRMNGLELLEKLHADASMSHVPFVMLTTEARPGIYEKAKMLGAKAWLIKPFKPDLLLAAVDRLVPR
ncbi:MAG TPA: response regulator [Kofleriaceae bacterium]|jgi:two-component system chemotaxis response regulator CheY